MFESQSIVLEPISQAIAYSSALEFADRKLGEYQDVVYLHSARKNAELARYSFIALSPFMKLESVTEGTDNSMEILDKVEEILAAYRLKKIPGLPPFQGGVAGYLSYDLVRTFEELPSYACNKGAVPRLAICVYDLVISVDHCLQEAWIISSGLPELNEPKRLLRARERINWLLQEMKQPGSLVPSDTRINIEDISSNFTQATYCETVKKAIEYIKNGDIFQVNLSQCFSCKMPQTISPLELFRRLQAYNPAPFSAFIAIGEITLISSSPERFIKLEGDIIETRPIKGTIKRSSNVQEDRRLATLLLNSEKDRSENAMVVDLMRNDLAKICKPHSIKVEKLCALETFETVHHLVSVVRGQLRATVGFKELLHAVIAGGSITGAPKIRAMEIIDELEPTRRGPYCGNAFYYGFDGSFDSSILIRTFVLCQDVLHFSAGGAIVLDSIPEAEYEETCIKAKALITTLITSSAERFSDSVEAGL